MNVELAPGIGATIYGSLPRDVSPELVRACDIVCLHTAADDSDRRTADVVRRLNPHAQVWLAIPGNYLVGRTDADAVREAERCARVAVDCGAEVFEPNGEGTSDGLKPADWIAPKGDAIEAGRLERLAVLIVDAVRAIVGDRVAIGWTSHDGTGFRIPRSHLELIDVHAPQHYPALPHVKGEPPPPLITQRGLERRVAWSRGQWESLAARGKIPADVCPYGRRWSLYTQGHGLTLGAMVWGLCEAATARLWAFPGSWSPAALQALTCARRIRDEVGHGPDAIERWQLAHALESDGIVGAATLRALSGARVV